MITSCGRRSCSLHTDFDAIEQGRIPRLLGKLREPLHAEWLPNSDQAIGVAPGFRSIGGFDGTHGRPWRHPTGISSETPKDSVVGRCVALTPANPRPGLYSSLQRAYVQRASMGIVVVRPRPI